MKLLLELQRRDGDFKEYIKYSRSALLGETRRTWAEAGGLYDYFDELVEYCPDLAEMSCHKMHLQLVEFGTSYDIRLEIKILDIDDLRLLLQRNSKI